ncbi:hypothetical protein D1007_18813 [Hordeum vulgare]|nr:hypothetical protein D1007_18813 [Hordeum vulgare]
MAALAWKPDALSPSLSDSAGSRCTAFGWLYSHCVIFNYGRNLISNLKPDDYRSVHEALLKDTWLNDLTHGLTEDMTTELTNLATMVDRVTLQDGQPDVITWRFAPNGEYSARSAYALQFEGATSMAGFELIWQAWAPGNCRFFVWTIMLGKIMTADALLRRGCENEYFCRLCERSLETPMHLFTECPWSRKIWNWTTVQAGLPSLQLTRWDRQRNFLRWLQNCVSMETTRKRKGLLSIMYLTI